jgi:hypothetical protein
MSKAFIIARLKEASTWRAIVVLLIACGIPIAPLLADRIIAIGLAVVGLIGIFMPDQLGKS